MKPAPSWKRINFLGDLTSCIEHRSTRSCQIVRFQNDQWTLHLSLRDASIQPLVESAVRRAVVGEPPPESGREEYLASFEIAAPPLHIVDMDHSASSTSCSLYVL